MCPALPLGPCPAMGSPEPNFPHHLTLHGQCPVPSPSPWAASLPAWRRLGAVGQEPSLLCFLFLPGPSLQTPIPRALAFLLLPHCGLSGSPFWKPKTGEVPSLSPPVGCVHPAAALGPLSFPGHQFSAASPAQHAGLSLPGTFPKPRCSGFLRTPLVSFPHSGRLPRIS